MNTPSQGTLLAAAIALARADPSLLQEEAESELRVQFPGIENPNCYANPAAEAVMQQIRLDQQLKTGLAEDLRRLRAKGLPEHMATRSMPPKPQDSSRKRTGMYDG